MTIEEIQQFGLSYTDRITLKTWIIETTNDTGKATFLFLKQPDKRKKEYFLIVKFYKCQNQTWVNINEITSITKGWD